MYQYFFPIKDGVSDGGVRVPDCVAETKLNDINDLKSHVFLVSFVSILCILPFSLRDLGGWNGHTVNTDNH